ncbi:hypothetical protein [Tritonibacter mobilis]|uniref:hypothetical protein n=1 Tax=Tritonibacter mobilis TaxID=379347 RepID=UPI000806CDF4|nr:hypothetical protein [Tritonibacter mobilis]
MPVLLILLLLGVLSYLYWRRHTTTLTRDCRWRRARSGPGWHCAFCGAVDDDAQPPRHCSRRAPH